MKNILILIIVSIFFSCNNLIKDETASVLDEVISSMDSANSNGSIDQLNSSDTAIFDGFEGMESKKTYNYTIKSKNDIIGNWVGWFRPNLGEEKNEEISLSLQDYGDAYFWGRENKINLAIEKIVGDSVFGHSVVAGNDRKFKGKLVETKTEINVNLSEPGDNKYDGMFSFQIKKNQPLLNGIWNSYKKLEIPKRIYVLEKLNFKFNSNQMLDSVYFNKFIDWEKGQGKVKVPWIGDEKAMVDGYLTTTKYIYKINASTQEITPKIAKELTSGDLSIIRNMIYARHGYSFKRKPLRVFFDAQDWYMPISADITKDLTELEKKNIQILMKYEKNAKAYYDYFGR